VFTLVFALAMGALKIVALREIFGARRRITDRLISLPIYLFLFLWSFGFGYGFWWSLIAGADHGGIVAAVTNVWQHILEYLSAIAKSSLFGKSTPKPIEGRDFIALLASLATEVGLFMMVALNPPNEPPEMRKFRPSASTERRVRDAIATAVSGAPGVDFTWIRLHFVGHMGRLYFVIPNLYSCDDTDREECTRAVAINQLAAFLTDLSLIRLPRPRRDWLLERSELDKLRREEEYASDTELFSIRRRWGDLHGVESSTPEPAKGILRNHGVFSKSERALQIAGWSEGARSDIEIYPVVEPNGLMLLAVLENRSLVDETSRPLATTE
jgi:hypothetical protein